MKKQYRQDVELPASVEQLPESIRSVLMSCTDPATEETRAIVTFGLKLNRR